MNTNVQLVKTVLKYTFGLVPLAAGLDKFLNVLTNWTQYLAPGLVEVLPVSAVVFMMVVGFIEMAAGALVLFKPQWGAPLVMVWLVLIALSLVFSGSYLDVAVRDLVMAVGAFALFKLSEE